MFEIVDGRQTDAGPWVSYKLTGEPSSFGSGELIILMSGVFGGMGNWRMF